MAKPSERALANIRRNLMMDLSREAQKYPPYSEDHPDGLIDITSSINTLMRKEMSAFVHTLPDIQGLEYGPVAGSARLMAAVAALVNTHFQPTTLVDASSILATNGVTSLLEIVTFAAGDAGTAILCITPAYGMFHTDVVSRNGIHLIPVPCEDAFDQFAAVNAKNLVQRFEAAYQRAIADGHAVHAVLLCNPCNPLGRCYSRTTLAQLASFCGRNRLHLISDEIYALSVTPAATLDTFTSVLAIDKEVGVDPQSIHVLYGASKDWGLGGLRLGFLITRNAVFKEACRRLCLFTWISSYSDAIFSAVISNDTFVAEYLVTFHRKLNETRRMATDFLSAHHIPFHPANAGVFLWIDLSRWTRFFDQDPTESSEVLLTKFLMSKGVYLEPGEVSESGVCDGCILTFLQAFFSPTPGKYRLVYSMSPNVLSIGLNRLITALKGVPER